MIPGLSLFTLTVCRLLHCGLSQPALQIISHLVTTEMAILQLAASITVNLQLTLTLLLSLPCDGLENSTMISFLAERTWNPMSMDGGAQPQRVGSVGLASSAHREAACPWVMLGPWSHRVVPLIQLFVPVVEIMNRVSGFSYQLQRF